MFRRFAFMTVHVVLLVSLLTLAAVADNQSLTTQRLNQMPLAFTKNMGQWDDRVLFRANADGATMWFTKEGITYQFTRHVAGHSREGGDPASVGVAPRGYPREGNHMGLPLHDPDDRDSIETLVLTAKFVGANANPEVVAEGQMEYKCNYFLGNDPSKWHTDVPNYEAITLKDIYPGIDLKYSGDGKGQAAYEFMVAPGADMAQIKVEYEGAEETSIDSDGRMTVRTKWGDMIAGLKSPTSGAPSGSCAWWTSPSTTLPQDLAHGDVRQARAFPGTSSVELVYSTYLGGDNYDDGWRIAVDGSGSAYVMGETRSSNFPTLNPYQSTYQGGGTYGGDVFVTKLSSSGDSLIYSTYLGGGSSDWAGSIAVDGSGYAYLTGETYSSDFPTLNPYQTFQDSSDVFVTKLSSSGNSVIYSTYLGGGDYDKGVGIAVDGSGYAYVTGLTGSSDFPTVNPYQDTYQGVNYDAFVTKLRISGKGLIYSTYLCGKAGDEGRGIAVDGDGNTYVTGITASLDFPTTSYPYQQTNNGGNDVFVTKFGTFPPYLCGDPNGSNNVNISDAVFLISYIFSGGPAPNPLVSGDANCSGSVNISDVVYLIAYIFSGGPVPCAGCK